MVRRRKVVSVMACHVENAEKRPVANSIALFRFPARVQPTVPVS
jgi:hypothetical protein